VSQAARRKPPRCRLRPGNSRDLPVRGLAGGGEFDGFTALAEAFPIRAFPDAAGLGPDGRENLLP
jgi:hypothetical protein